MDCKINDCSRKIDCTILGILGKQPKDAESCSYFKSAKQQEKKAKTLAQALPKRSLKPFKKK